MSAAESQERESQICPTAGIIGESDCLVSEETKSNLLSYIKNCCI